MTDDPEQTDKGRKERSPSFPFIALDKAVERLRAMAEAHKRSHTRLATVGETWGYGAKSSGLLQTVAALKAFGLIDDMGSGADRRVQVSDLGWRILHDERPGAREQAILEAAQKPRLIAEYVGQWVPDRPSDSHCLSELHLDRGFTSDAAKLFLRVFDDTIAFANLKEGDSVHASPKGVEINVPPLKMQLRTAAPTVEAGDPFRISFGTGAMEVVGRLTTTEQVDDLIRSLNAIKLLFKPSSSVKKPDESE